MSGRGRPQQQEDFEDYGRGRSASPGRSGSPQGRAPQRGGRSQSPAASMFGDDMTPEEQAQYQELLDHFGGDEQALQEAIEQFMEEYQKDPEKFERMMQEEEEAEMQRQGGGGGGQRRR